MEEKVFKQIIKAYFGETEHLPEICNFGNGHINDTYFLNFANGDKFILQRINDNTFKEVDKLMKNIEAVLNYIKIRNKNVVFPELIKTKEKQTYFYSEDGFYRVYTYIDRTKSYFYTNNNKIFRQSAEAFADFQIMLNDFPADKLYVTIPDFHNTAKRFQALINSINNNVAKRVQSCQELIEKILARKHYSEMIIKPLEQKEIPLRVTHNDSKISNVLFDENDKYVCIVDFDTIMSGSLLYDFGDAVRDGCSTTKEDEPDLDKVDFDLERFGIYTTAYYNKLSNIITVKEKEMLLWAPIVLTYELSIRFLCDYIDGDIYFKTDYENHNLIRAKCQCKLLECMEKKLHKMENIVKKL